MVHGTAKCGAQVRTVGHPVRKSQVSLSEDAWARTGDVADPNPELAATVSARIGIVRVVLVHFGNRKRRLRLTGHAFPSHPVLAINLLADVAHSFHDPPYRRLRRLGLDRCANACGLASEVSRLRELPSKSRVVEIIRARYELLPQRVVRPEALYCDLHLPLRHIAKASATIG